MDLHAILRSARTVAIVGCSDSPYRASNRAAEMLSTRGYKVIPVNPKYRSVNGIPCLADFGDIGDDVQIDIVNIFRNASATLGAVQAVVDRAARTGRKPVIWTQIGVSSGAAEEAAKEAGLTYVREKCIMVELEAMLRE